ncbi:ORF_59 [Adoxophyes orana granulovirus]|uniref:BV-E31 n=1 Tax=Adoxophyes orana granulovirus TaxID=170617 RepID=Q7T9V6_GVAO|nr:ORF_59 [Adoxophyes orana granulovirus]AAP85696.1 ORF_59 [Adoxophyes orana granulovirus]AJA91698.1 BV-E31 [Adoxophyes orana granulovirus]
MVKRGKHAGLLLITENNKAVILQATKSYNDNVNKNLKYNKHIPFVEKLSIPRGKHDAGEKDYETAVREFIEETGLVFDKICVFGEPFMLEWQDNCKIYKYVVYVGFLMGTLYYLKKKPNSYIVKLRARIGSFAQIKIYDYKVDMLRQKFRTQELVRRIELMNLSKYITYMENRQLSTYKYSNYLLFFDYVYSVQKMFSNFELDNFFFIDLQWCVESEEFDVKCCL